MAKKRIKKKTYSEFLSWLEGVESMQEADWTPNQTQWKKVREMLNHIKPDEIEIEVTPTAPAMTARPVAPRQVAGFTPPAPGETVGRVVENDALPQSTFNPPPARVPVKPNQTMAVPSGVKAEPGSLLDPGKPHKADEFL